VRLLRAVTGKISFSDRGFIMSSKASLACAGAFAAAATFAGIAFAAEPAPTPPPPIPVFTWTGLYVGGQIGYAWGRDPVSWSGISNDDELASGAFNHTPQGVIGGAHVGYNLQYNQWLVFGSKVPSTARVSAIPLRCL
jgi:outer membrane immunogenic protein